MNNNDVIRGRSRNRTPGDGSSPPPEITRQVAAVTAFVDAGGPNIRVELSAEDLAVLVWVTGRPLDGVRDIVAAWEQIRRWREGANARPPPPTPKDLRDLGD